MQVSRGLDRVGVDFDDEHLVANAGLIAPASLAQHLGLREPVSYTHLDVYKRQASYCFTCATSGAPSKLHKL